MVTLGMELELDLLKRLYSSLSFYLGYPLVRIKARFSSLVLDIVLLSRKF